MQRTERLVTILRGGELLWCTAGGGSRRTGQQHMDEWRAGSGGAGAGEDKLLQRAAAAGPPAALLLKLRAAVLPGLPWCAADLTLTPCGNISVWPTPFEILFSSRERASSPGSTCTGHTIDGTVHDT